MNLIVLTADQAANGMSPLFLIGFYVLIFGAMYFALIRPQQKRKKKEQELRNSAQVGDEIVTIGGICGRIIGIKDEDTIVIETGTDRSRIKLKRWAIGQLLTEHDDAETK